MQNTNFNNTNFGNTGLNQNNMSVNLQKEKEQADNIQVIHGKKWDYQTPVANQITQEFKNSFYTNIKGKECILQGGCIVLAHKKGIKSWLNEFVQMPNKENNYTAIVKSTIVGYGWDVVENKICEVTFEEYGDANVSNCGSLVREHFIRMAVTRARNRVAKVYVGLDCLTLDELKDTDNSLNTVPVTPELINEYNSLIKAKNIDPTTLNGITNFVLNTNSNVIFGKLSAVDACRVLGALRLYNPPPHN